MPVVVFTPYDDDGDGSSRFYAADERVLNSDGGELTYRGFNPLAIETVDIANDSLTVTDHGLTTGEAVVYQPDGSGTVAGLIDKQTYFVVAIDALKRRFDGSQNAGANIQHHVVKAIHAYLRLSRA